MGALLITLPKDRRLVWYLAAEEYFARHIRTLRQKLGNYGHIIETVRNVGYRLEAKHDK